MNNLLKLLSIAIITSVFPLWAVTRHVSVTPQATREANLRTYLTTVDRFMNVAGDSSGFDLRNAGKSALAESETLSNGYTVAWNCRSIKKLWMSGNTMDGHENVFAYLTPDYLPTDAAIEFPSITSEACRAHARKAMGRQEAGWVSSAGTYCYAFVHGYIARTIQNILRDRDLGRFFADDAPVLAQFESLLRVKGVDRLNRSFMRHYYSLIFAVVIQRMLNRGEHAAVLRIINRMPIDDTFGDLLLTNSWMDCSLAGGEKTFRELAGTAAPVVGMRAYDVIMTSGNGSHRKALFAAAARAGHTHMVESMLHTGTHFPERPLPSAERDNKTIVHELCAGRLEAAALTRCLQYCDRTLHVPFDSRDTDGRSPLDSLRTAYRGRQCWNEHLLIH